ncbi:MAG TPA: ABC transporter permease [Candidatus Dormibacteraeota bacterium]|nr:ABC transporter permease [Candidatus Dormibacteraeota bacterium]
MLGWIRYLWQLVAVPLASFVLALLVGAIVIILSSTVILKNPFDPTLPLTAYVALAQGAVGDFNSVVTTLVLTAPLIFAGLGVGIGFRAGLFNIGGQGQFLMGAVGSVWVAAYMQNSPAAIAVPAALLGGALVGAAWGFIPGILKATSGAHEVVTTIMMNYIALASLAWIVKGPLKVAGSNPPTTVDVGPASLPILFGRNGHLGILLAFLAVPIAWYLLFRTTRGFEIRATGSNPEAARYAGVNPRLLIVLTMTLAGMLAGLAGAITILGVSHRMNTTFQTKVGFDAITVALLGRSNPIGILFAALLFGALRAGAAPMQINAGIPVELVDFLEALILLFLIANVVLRRLLRLRGVTGVAQADFQTITRSYGREGVT